MVTINVSAEAFRAILKRKREMEEENQKVVTIAHALDSLLEWEKEQREAWKND